MQRLTARDHHTSNGVTRAEAFDLVAKAIDEYDRKHEPYSQSVQAKLDTLAHAQAELYGNGSGTPGYLERARAEDRQRQAHVDARLEALSGDLAALAERLDSRDTAIAALLTANAEDKARAAERQKMLQHISTGIKALFALTASPLIVALWHWLYHLLGH